jgi:hypothetical protein
MDLLITVIGNAVADPAFRTVLLENPREAMDDWGFHLTKGDVGMLELIFTKEHKEDLAKKFDELQGTLFQILSDASKRLVLPCPQKRCMPVAFYPPSCRKTLREEVDALRQGAVKEAEKLREEVDALRQAATKEVSKTEAA